MSPSNWEQTDGPEQKVLFNLAVTGSSKTYLPSMLVIVQPAVTTAWCHPVTRCGLAWCVKQLSLIWSCNREMPLFYPSNCELFPAVRRTYNPA